ncbi:MAG: MFS transporter [Streptosporangiaceae bacterium]
MKAVRLKAGSAGKARFDGVLGHRSFRRLFAGVTASRIGDAMTFIVITWLALRAGGPRAVGLVAFAGGCAGPVTAPVIGHLIDRLGLRLLMLTDNLARGCLMASMGILLELGIARLGYLVAFAAGAAALSPATELARDVGVPALVGEGQLDAANRLLSSSWDLAAWIGPALAGLAMGVVGPAPVLFIDSATFIAMALVALGMPGRCGQPPTGGDQGLAAGFRLLWRLRPVAIITLIGVADLFLAGVMEVFLPAFSKLTLHEGPAVYGLLVSLAGLACLAGTLFLTPLVSRLGYGSALIVVLAVRGLAVLPIALAGSWWLAAVLVSLAAVPDGSFFPISATIRQRLIPAQERGKVAGASGALGAAGFPLGSAVGGLLIAAAGTRFTAAAMAFGYVSLAAAVLPVWSAFERLGRRTGTDQVPVAVGALDPPDRRPVL